MQPREGTCPGDRCRSPRSYGLGEPSKVTPGPAFRGNRLRCSATLSGVSRRAYTDRQVPVQLAVPGAAGHNRWGVAETPLPAKTQGRTRVAAFNRVSFKPERASNVIAYVRDWEHAETVRRRCLRTVRGFALHAECTGPGRHVGESAPGPTGLMWASEPSEPRHAQAERPPTERSGALC